MSNFWKWVLHSIVSALLVAIPYVFTIHPGWLDFTVGGGLAAFYQYLIATQTTTNTVAFK